MGLEHVNILARLRGRKIKKLPLVCECVQLINAGLGKGHMTKLFKPEL